MLGVACVVSAVAVLAPGHARAAGTVLPEPTGPVATGLDLEVAVASTPSGSTRWQRFTLNGARKALWLVPARPGAALDLAGGSFLDALDDATKPRVRAPSFAGPIGCDAQKGVDVPQWTSFAGSTGELGSAVVLDSETSARAHIASLGYLVSTRAASRIQSAFADGWKLVAMEVQGQGGTTSSPALRVSDDGPPLLPLALTGGADVDMHLTTFVLGTGAASLPRMLDAVGPYAWSATGSDYLDQFYAQRDGLRFFREAAGHDLLFVDTNDGGLNLASVATLAYVDRCATSITNASSSALVVGRTCAAGALGRVPGGAPCVPGGGDLSASQFTCGASDDLALAVSGQRPRDVAVTRLSALLAGGSYALDVPLTWESTTMSPVKRAESYTCPAAPTQPSSSGFVDTPASPSPSAGGGEWVVTHESCTSSSTVVVDDDSPPPADDGCGGSTTTTSATDPDTTYRDSESCTGTQSSSSSSSGESGWDSSDDSSDSSSSSSSSDSCGGGSSSSSSSSGDGWDSKDDSSSSDSCSSHSSSSSEATAIRVAKTGRPLALHLPKKPARRRPSPLSRVTIVAAALLLPLRRRLRARDGAGSSRADFRA